MDKIFIADSSMSSFGRIRKNLIEIIKDAVEGLSYPLKDVDAVFLGLMNPEGFVGVGNIASFVSDRIGLSGKPSVRIETASSTGAAVFYYAYAMLASKIYKNVLVIAAEKMTHLDTPKVTGLISEVIDPNERKIGVSMPSLGAMVANRFAYEMKLTPERLEKLLFWVAEKNHFYGQYNNIAQFKREITFDDYTNSKMISTPLRLYDCSPISDGACAVVLSRQDGDVEVLGVGQGTDKQALSKRDFITGFVSTRKAAKQAFEMAGITPENIDFCEIHDAFTPFEITGIIDTGLLKENEIYNFYENRQCWHNGKLPVNISGGLKSRGHPVGASGLAQIVEAYRIITGKGDATILPEKREVGLTQSIGGLATNNFVSILRKKGAYLKRFTKVDISFSENKIKKSKLLNIYTFTSLKNPPEGFIPPLNIVMCEREGKKFLAKFEGDEKDMKISGRLKIVSKKDGILTVSRLRRLKIFEK